MRKTRLNTLLNGPDKVDIHATVNLSASPFHTEKFTTRLGRGPPCAAAVLNHPFLLANQVGGNDDLLFDGRSLVVWPDGRAVVAPSWQEGVLVVDLKDAHACTWVPSQADDALCIGSSTPMVLESGDDGSSFVDTIEELTNAVVTGLADYCRKSSIGSIVLGLSGGIDSAVAACVAAEAIGPANVYWAGDAKSSFFATLH